MTTTLIEAIARAIEPDWFGEVDGKHPLDNYPLQHEAYQTRARAYAQAALTAIANAGYVIVPFEPTAEMLATVDDEDSDKYVARGRAYSAWQAMIVTHLEGDKK